MINQNDRVKIKYHLNKNVRKCQYIMPEWWSETQPRGVKMYLLPHTVDSALQTWHALRSSMPLEKLSYAMS